jgi:hypothetical protein
LAQLNIRLEIHSGPDDWGRYVFTRHWDTDSPPYCSDCGSNVSISDGLIACSKCGAAGPTMHRTQVFRAPLPPGECGNHQA